MRKLLTLLTFASALYADGTIAHLAVGGPWNTTFILANTTSFAEDVTVLFWDDGGNALTLPVVNLGPYPGFSVHLPPRGMTTVETNGDPNGAILQGSATVTGRSVSGTSIFHQSIQGYPDFEAAVPISTLVQRLVLPFDNSNNYVTGIALVDPNHENLVVSMTIRDANGTIITNTYVPRVYHQSFVLPDSYPETANIAGTVEFVAYQPTDSGFVATAGISGIALRFNPTGPFTTLEALYAGNY